MNREERLQAGWVECWGLFEYRESGCYWQGSDAQWNQRRPPKRMRYPTFGDAQREARQWPRTVPRRFWRRKKKPAPPPLKVGDEVMVRAKLVTWQGPPDPVGSPLNALVRLSATRDEFWISSKDIIR